MEFKFFNPYAGGRRTQNRLPQWEQEGALYFVNFHLADSLPAEFRIRLERERDAWLAAHPYPWLASEEEEYRERFLATIERCLDEGRGDCPLRRPECSAIVADAMRHFDGERVDVMAFVIMPNHVHAAIIPRTGWHLEQLIHSWKQWTAKRINPLIGKSGKFWQEDYFDTILRDGEHLGRVLRYIRNNPGKSQPPLRRIRPLRERLRKAIPHPATRRTIGAGLS